MNLGGVWRWLGSDSTLRFVPTERPDVWKIDSPRSWVHGYYVRPHASVYITTDAFNGYFDLYLTLHSAVRVRYPDTYFAGVRVEPPLVVL